MVECRALMILSTTINPGGMAEWTKAVVLKTTVGETSPGVRIPLPPPYDFNWGGAGVDDRGRLLSGCRGKTRPRVRIPPSPPIIHNVCHATGKLALVAQRIEHLVAD